MSDYTETPAISATAAEKIAKAQNRFLSAYSLKEDLRLCYERHVDYVKSGAPLPFDRDRFAKAFRAKDFWKNIFGCGSWLEFRWYDRSDTLKLHNANFCKKDRLCPACAVRRAYKQQIKFQKIYQEYPEVAKRQWAYIVLTVPHTSSEPFIVVFDRIREVLRKMTQSIRDSKRYSNFWEAVGGGMYSIETTHGKNGWHVHVNLLVNLKKPLDLVPIRNRKGEVSYQCPDLRRWLIASGAGQMHNVDLLDMDDDEKRKDALLEILKYSTKFSDLSNQQLLTFYVETYGKRLFASFGNLWGLGIEDVELEGDEVLDEDFWEFVYLMSADGGSYKLFRSQKNETDKTTTTRPSATACSERSLARRETLSSSRVSPNPQPIRESL